MPPILLSLHSTSTPTSPPRPHDSPDVIAELEEAAPLYSTWLRLVYEQDEIRGLSRCVGRWAGVGGYVGVFGGRGGPSVRR